MEIKLGAGDENKVVSILAYYGNVVSIPFDEKQGEELKEKPLNWLADEIQDFLIPAATTGHFLELGTGSHIFQFPEAVLAKIYATRVQRGKTYSKAVVSARHQFPVAEMDFGWEASRFHRAVFHGEGNRDMYEQCPAQVEMVIGLCIMPVLQQQLSLF